MRLEGEFVFAMIILFEPVHSGLKTASEVRVIMFEGAIVRTPFDGRVKGVQCGRVVVVVDTNPFQRALPSIFKSLQPCRWSSMVVQQWLIDIVSSRENRVFVVVRFNVVVVDGVVIQILKRGWAPRFYMGLLQR